MSKLLLIVIIWNMLVFLFYGIDKRKAIKHKQRISEAALLWTTACFGSLGALLGMYCFHHKTKKRKFQVSVPLLFLLHCSFIYWLIN